MEESTDKATASIETCSDEKVDPESADNKEGTSASSTTSAENPQLTASLPMNLGLLDLRKVTTDSHRKMSNDSGISALSSNAGYTDKESPPSSAHSHEELIGEPRLAPIHLQLLAQQSMNPAAASLNPATAAAYFGLQPNSLLSAQSQLWANPLVGASLLQQQQEAARKVLESATNGKPSARPFKQYPKDAAHLSFPSSFYSLPSFLPSANMPSGAIPDSNAFTQSLKLQEQMINAYKAQLQQQTSEEPAIKVARKSHSFSGGSSSPGAVTNVGSPGGPLHRLSPSNGGQLITVSGDERTNSYQGDEDRQSVESNKSSLNSFDVKSTHSATLPPQTHEAQPHPVAVVPTCNSRRRKLGVIGSVDGIPALSELNYMTSSQSVTGSLSTTPTSKISTASLPANLSTMRPQRKRPRSLAPDVKDESYWERRRKNNEAAKRSRDSRRQKEDEVALRAAFLEQENLRMRLEMATMRQELTQLKFDYFRNEVEAHQKKKAAIAESEPTPPTSPPSNEA